MRSLLYTVAVLALGLASCEKVIDLYPQSNLNVDNFYRNLGELNSALTGCYNGLQRTMTEEWTLTELRSDNTVMGATGSTSQVNRDLSDLDMFFPSTSHQGNYNYWIANYYNIRNINLVLNALGADYNDGTGAITFTPLSIPVTESDAKKLAAEACFLRAYHYFNLVRLYGGVFLVHEPVTPQDAKQVNRASVEQVYKLIIADLQTAATNGSTVKYASIPATSLGRANAWAAKALLGKVLLTLNRKAEAATLLQDVIANSGYSLQPMYANIFSTASEMSSEVLFAVRYKAGGLGLGSNFPNLFAPLNSGAAVVNGDGSGYNFPASELVNLYTAADARKAVNIGIFGTGTAARPYAKKHISTVAVARDAENDWVVLRFADVLLLLAEAQGNTPASLALINQVRKRAALADLTAEQINSVEAFEKALSEERRLELAFENQRWFDMVRFNTTLTTLKAEQVLKDHFAAMYPTHYALYPAPRLTLAELQGFARTDRLLLPIPQREIDNNTQLRIEQNPGY